MKRERDFSSSRREEGVKRASRLMNNAEIGEKIHDWLKIRAQASRFYFNKRTILFNELSALDTSVASASSCLETVSHFRSPTLGARRDGSVCIRSFSGGAAAVGIRRQTRWQNLGGSVFRH